MTRYFSGTSLISEVQKYHKEEFSSFRPIENEGPDSFLYEQTGEKREDAECGKSPKKCLHYPMANHQRNWVSLRKVTIHCTNQYK